MKYLNNKLRSRQGSSMIIALVFMLICVFIGGAVLTNATVNAGRAAGKKDKYQAILNQRSTLSVLVNYLSDNEGNISQTAEFVTDLGGRKTVKIGSETGIRRIILTAAKQTVESGEDSTVEFSVVAPDGTTKVGCYVTCFSDNYSLEIGFTENTQEILKVFNVMSSTAIKWDSCRIEKAVQE